jgi:hypothetical protein
VLSSGPIIQENAMTAGKQLRFYSLIFVVATTAIEIGKGEAWAIGFGFELFRQVPSPQQFINDHALVRAAAGQKLPSRNVYANNSNSYINRIRDNGMTSHYGVESRGSPGYNVARRRTPSVRQANNNVPPSAAVAAPEADPRPVYPMSSFFSAARVLVWPAESPVTDELKPKREISDQGCLVVLEMVEKYRSAPITTVTEARQKLLDYGQPALRLVRSVSTPRLAESFHLFLLSLYDSLGAAANPAEGA